MRQTELIMLGTGNAAVTRCYNTCFALRTDRGILLTDAGRLAEGLKVKHLVLYHTEDKTLDTRKLKYTEEAAGEFKGRVFVPDDLERISL